jgi:hypothetical protein
MGAGKDTKRRVSAEASTTQNRPQNYSNYRSLLLTVNQRNLSAGKDHEGAGASESALRSQASKFLSKFHSQFKQVTSLQISVTVSEATCLAMSGFPEDKVKPRDTHQLAGQNVVPWSELTSWWSQPPILIFFLCCSQC